jgi:hypothetical protein
MQGVYQSWRGARGAMSEDYGRRTTSPRPNGTANRTAKGWHAKSSRYGSRDHRQRKPAHPIFGDVVPPYQHDSGAANTIP